MRIYLDTSALVKLYVDEEGSPLVRDHVDQALLVATSMISYGAPIAPWSKIERIGYRDLLRMAQKRP